MEFSTAPKFGWNSCHQGNRAQAAIEIANNAKNKSLEVPDEVAGVASAPIFVPDASVVVDPVGFPIAVGEGFPLPTINDEVVTGVEVLLSSEATPHTPSPRHMFPVLQKTPPQNMALHNLSTDSQDARQYMRFVYAQNNTSHRYHRRQSRWGSILTQQDKRSRCTLTSSFSDKKYEFNTHLAEHDQDPEVSPGTGSSYTIGSSIVVSKFGMHCPSIKSLPARHNSPVVVSPHHVVRESSTFGRP